MNRRHFLTAAGAGFAAATCGRAADAPPAAPQQPAGFAPDSLFLSWQADPTTTMTVQWVGEAGEATANPVRYAPAAGDQWATEKAVSKPWPTTDLNVHRTTLTGLTPGTDYRFRLGERSAEYKFRTAPAKATDTFQWVSGGDCGTGPHAVGTNVLAAKQEPYFALIGGDLGYDNGKSAATALRFIQNYSKTMADPKGRLVPMVTCIGNHEVDGSFHQPREKATFYFPLFDGLYPETSYATLDFGDYLSLVLLDTAHVSRIEGEQTDWLGKTLAERETRPHLIVANHVPAYPSYRNPMGRDGKLGTGEGNRIHWCPLFERYRVDAVLEHHDHTFKKTHRLTDGRRDENGVIYLGDGSWGQLRVPVPPEKRPYLAAVGHAYHMSVHRLEGTERFHVALEESGRVADVTASRGKRPARRG